MSAPTTKEERAHFAPSPIEVLVEFIQLIVVYPWLAVGIPPVCGQGTDPGWPVADLPRLDRLASRCGASLQPLYHRKEDLRP